jgi:hypothetical protein
MQDSQIPAKFPIPFANSASSSYKRAIPTASQIGVQNGAASLTDGFPPNCFIPIAAGGSWPFGMDVNGILNQSTAWHQWIQAGAPIFYDSTFQSAIGGYPFGAIVASVAYPQSWWFCTVNNNTTNPDTGGAGWIPQITRGSTQYISNNTWICPNGVFFVKAIVTGGGGGGSGCNTSIGTGLGDASGSGGGAGGTSILTCSVIPGTGYAVVVGGGGAGGGNPTNAAPGGASSFGAFSSANGGVAGNFSSPNNSPGGSGGSASGGFIIPGGYGSDGQSAGLIFAGNGGASYWGGGGRAGQAGGFAGQAWGSGGGGAYDGGASGLNKAGGGGQLGCVFLEW